MESLMPSPRAWTLLQTLGSHRGLMGTSEVGFRNLALDPYFLSYSCSLWNHMSGD